MSVRPFIVMALVLVLATLCLAPSICAAESPSVLQATAGVGYVDLNWQTVPGAGHYSVYRGSENGMTRLANVTGPFTAYHDGDAAKNANYLYYVTAWSNGTEGAPSNTVSVTVLAEGEGNIILPVLAIVLSIIAVQICIVMLLYFSKQKMQLK